MRRRVSSLIDKSSPVALRKAVSASSRSPPSTESSYAWWVALDAVGALESVVDAPGFRQPARTRTHAPIRRTPRQRGDVGSFEEGFPGERATPTL